MRGDKIDQAVKQRFLAALEPAPLEVSLAALDQIEARARQIERQWQLRQERAQYEVDLARRRSISIDLENRLVAWSLEREWNEKLSALETLEREYVAWGKQVTRPLSAEDYQRILGLAQDLPTVWHSVATTNSERKQLRRPSC
jgi:hypothetical protein